MKERSITDDILLAASNAGARLFRQNVGLGWIGKMIRKTKTTLTLEHPRPLHAGLCKGSSDIIGWTPVEITPEMVGATVAVFTAVEVKTPGVQLSTEQDKFIKIVRSHGGFALMARGVDHYEDQLQKQKAAIRRSRPGPC